MASTFALGVLFFFSLLQSTSLLVQSSLPPPGHDQQPTLHRSFFSSKPAPRPPVQNRPPRAFDTRPPAARVPPARVVPLYRFCWNSSAPRAAVVRRDVSDPSRGSSWPPARSGYVRARRGSSFVRFEGFT
uniref:(northern house mosquito) hypothetical protein n=1 Tax=Culex pipiens TaxID=7175 RepID=A0A8D8DPQ4_CULPI